MGEIEPKRREQRHHLAKEISLDPLALNVFQAYGAEKRIPSFASPADFLIQQLVLARHQRMSPLGYQLEYLMR